MFHFQGQNLAFISIEVVQETRTAVTVTKRCVLIQCLLILSLGQTPSPTSVIYFLHGMSIPFTELQFSSSEFARRLFLLSFFCLYVILKQVPIFI